MIELTRLNNRPLVVNSDLIKFIENTPDTVLTLITGEKVVVSEPCDVVIDKVIEFRRKATAGMSYLSSVVRPECDEDNAQPPVEDLED